MSLTILPSPLIIITIALVAGATKPVYAFNPDEWLNKPTENNGTVHDEIQCYALPYGAIGFASHILTYLTVLCLSQGRNPLMPWRPLKNKRFNLVVSIIGFLISFPLTVVTMIRCRNTWSFILIAVWKLVLSSTLTAMSIHAGRHIIDIPKPKRKRRQMRETGIGLGIGSESTEAMIPMNNRLEPPRNSYFSRGGSNDRYSYHSPSRDASPLGSPYLTPSPGSESAPLYGNRSASPYHRLDNSDVESDHELEVQGYASRRNSKSILAWTPLYFLGAVVGFVGVMNVVRKNIASNHQLQIVTGVFGGVVLLMVLLVVVLMCCLSDSCFGKLGWSLFWGSLTGILVLTILFALYTDWALASIMGDIVGRPSKDNALFYWTYFASKRLPMLSF